jgi:1-acyl-sn-glycerol-3-phosphate acyltransferase
VRRAGGRHTEGRASLTVAVGGHLRRWLRLPAMAAAGLLGVIACVVAVAGSRDAAMRIWCGLAARSLGVRYRQRGGPPPAGCLVASNHLGYLDPLLLGAFAPGSFLAKAEIARWPLLGALTRSGGAVFIDRDRPRAVRPAVELIARKLGQGERVLVFPEARVSPDGVTLGRFHPMLFEAAIETGRAVVPTAIRFERPADPGVWAWIDEPSLWRHLWHKLLPAGPVEVEVRFGSPLRPVPEEERKEFAERVRSEVIRLLEGGDG